MTGDQRVGLTAITLVCPGFAHAVTGRRRTAAVLAALGTLPGPLVLWFGLPILAGIGLVRIVAAVLGYLATRRASAASWGGLVPTSVVLVGLAGLAFLKIGLEIYRVPSSSMVPAVGVKSSILADQLTIHWRAPARGEVVLFDYPCEPDHTYVKRVIAIAGDSVEVRCGIVYVNGAPIASELVKDRDSYLDVIDDRETRPEVSRYREHHGGHTYDVFHPVEYKPTSPDDRDFPQRGVMPSCKQAELGDQVPARATGTVVEVSGKRKACEQQAHYVVPARSIFVMGDNRNNANDSRVYGAVSLDAVTGRLIETY